MSFLLDTDIVIYRLNEVQAASDLIDELFHDRVAIGIITYVEVLDGIDRSSNPRLARERFLLT